MLESAELTGNYSTFSFNPTDVSLLSSSAIQDKWLQLGGGRGFLGDPIISETTSIDGIGRFRHFQGGVIYWSPTTGAYEVHGDIKAKWA